MKRSLLSAAILTAYSGVMFAAQPVVIATPAPTPTARTYQNVNPINYEIMDQMVEHLRKRHKQLKEWMKDPDYVFAKADGKWYLDIGGYHFEIDKGEALPIYPYEAIDPVDESYERVLWDVTDPDWEISGYHKDTVFVNKKFGNYDYGKGCLIEIAEQYKDNPDYLHQEQFTCHDGSIGELPVFEEQRLPDGFFGVKAEYANFTGIERYEDKVIAAHTPLAENAAYSESLVGIYDLKNKTTVTYRGINKSEKYESLDDVRVNGNLLYVSAVGGHGRIDVFNIDTNEYYYSYSVGKRGDSFAKIAVNDRYILVNLPQGIAVFAIEPVEFGKTKSIKPRGYLDYTHGQPHAIEFIGDKVLTASNSGSAVYRLDNLQEGVVSQPIVKNLRGFEAMDSDGEYIVVKANHNTKGRLAYYNVEEFIADGYQFEEAAKAAYTFDKIWNFNAVDLVLQNGELITLKEDSVSYFPKVNTLSFTRNDSVAEKKLAFDDLGRRIHAKITPILMEQDFSDYIVESVNLNSRSMVHVRMLGDNNVEILNGTGLDLENVALKIRAHQQKIWALLATLDKLPKNTRIIMPLKAIRADRRFNAIDGSGVFDYSSMLDNMPEVGTGYGHYSTLELIDSHFSTTTSHPLLDKLAKIDANWDINFLNTVLGVPVTVDWTTDRAIRHIELIVNMAYVFSSDELKYAIMNYKKTYGHDMRLGARILKTPDDYRLFLNESLDENAFLNYRNTKDFAYPTGMSTRSGSLFGVPDHELDRIDQGNLKPFLNYMAHQLRSNFFKKCAPTPCGWNEQDLTKLLVDVTNKLRAELPYTM